MIAPRKGLVSIDMQRRISKPMGTSDQPTQVSHSGNTTKTFALGYHVAAGVLHRIGMQRLALGDFSDAQAIAFAFLSAAQTLECLSVELLFKGLLWHEEGSYPRGHKLLGLFERLPEDMRDRIRQHYGAARPPLDELLPAVSDWFEHAPGEVVKFRVPEVARIAAATSKVYAYLETGTARKT